MADRLARCSDDCCFSAEMAVGVDLYLDAAIGENPLGNDRYQIDAFDLLTDDEGRGLVVGIGCTSADRGDKAAVRIDQFALPGVALGAKRHHRRAAICSVLQD